MTSKDIVKHCLEGLNDNHIKSLVRHVNEATPILCGCEDACDFFILDGRADPVILACYNEVYTTKNVRFLDLHPSVVAIYQIISQRAKHSGYVNALQMLSQYDVQRIIMQIAKDRGL